MRSAVTSELGETPAIPMGVYIAWVFSDSPAEDVGLQPFRSFPDSGRADAITTVDGKLVGSIEEIVGYFNIQEPGTDVTLSICRDTQTIEIHVTLAEWPDG